MVDRSAIEQLVQHYPFPAMGHSLAAIGAQLTIGLNGAEVAVQVALGFPAASVKTTIEKDLAALIRPLDGVGTVQVEVVWTIGGSSDVQQHRTLEKVKNIVAVASGKGGVGKSTTAVNLALALLAEGAKVGLLDADIYGPSQQMMLGVAPEQRPDQHDEQYLLPVAAQGLKTMSMGYLTTDKTPVVWRGPMAGGALKQLLTQTWWGDLDYLIIDMPPGTGDIQLTLSQSVSLSGAVIVTTPQDIALIDAQKGVEMFRKVQVPVLGVVENMAIHICSECGHREALFGEGGGERIARDYSMPLLGSLPLSLQIRQQLDAGNPTVAAEPDGAIAGLYREIARATTAQLALRVASASAQAIPNIVIKAD
ncbi:MAG: ATP-binding protein involved in chromosome partitioning [Paraglaciecola psychrophila]|jgi:ATP-binding protein involved in chromosome partitioning